jgi:hypothetical protein
VLKKKIWANFQRIIELFAQKIVTKLSNAGFRIRIHFFRIRRWRLETTPDPDPIRIQGFNDQKLKKITAEKKIKFFLDKKL